MSKKYTSISRITASSIFRISTGQPELDWLYGVSTFSDGDHWGMPVGTISTWVGEGGVGKSRLAIDVARAKVIDGSTVMYFQNEVDLSTLASWVRGNTELENFYCSDVTSLADQMEIIKEVAPQLVFIDSINLVDEFGTGTAKSIKTIIDGFRSVIRETGSHIVILCQLNKEGLATGSTALSHLPDTNLILTNHENDFKVAIGRKNRYGKKGSKFFGIWRHTDIGVECISNNRANDERTNEWPELGPIPIINTIDLGEIPELGPNPEMINMSSFFDEKPIDGPTLVKNKVTLKNCDPQVREYMYKRHPELRPNKVKDVAKAIFKFAKKNWDRQMGK